MTVEELFGTLQQSVVAGWRKHLRSAKYGKHIALQEFYEEMPDKVDDLIEAWMGAYGKKIGNYVNIISSANMNTLMYLKELRKVAKQGYALMNGEAELEALLDDIVELIDSTLYKVKELSECKLKDLKDYINESLVCEAKNEYTLVWQHDNPESAVLINEPFAKISKITKDWDIELCEVKAKGNLIGVEWNDEWGYSWSVEGNNINTATRLEINHLEQELSKRTYNEEDGYIYIESKMFGMENEWWDLEEKPSSKEVFGWFKSIFDKSRVDRDSSSARAIIDLKKGEVVLGYEDVTIMSWEEFQDAYGYYEDED